MSVLDSGVIGGPRPIPTDAPMGADTMTAIASGPIPDLPLGTLPADVSPFEPPEFALSRKEFEQTGAPLGGGVPGAGLGATPTETIQPALDGAHGVLSGAQHTLGNAQSVLANAQSALDNVPAALTSAQAALARAAADPASILPPLPADPVGDLMKGLALPAVPGLDALFKPFLDLLKSFGTGALGQFNPTTLLSQGSKLIESAVQVGSGALKTVESLWQGKASQSAQETGKQAENHGQETAQRGFDLSTITNQAAAVVQRGNIQLTAIAQAFAAEATAMAPLILTPVGQTTLIASATRHLGEAVTVVNATHGELSIYTAQVQGLIGQLVGQGGGPNPAEVAQSLAQNVGQPILEQAKGLLESGLQAGTPGTDPAKTDPLGGAPDTTAAGVGGGVGGGAGGGGGIGGGGGLGSTPDGPGSSIPGGKVANPANPFGAGLGGVAGMGGPAGSGFMGSPAAAGAGKGGAPDGQHGRTVQPHQSPTAESELTGNLGTFAPGVIGEPDEPAETDES
ncbi:hypothetical protein [Nocardia seriolae]|uniref:Uncharacterized protein n=1 Tax=Nocardia seriolae TaxID=37332 RepID=A0ABC9YY21_9NOCA|nr:hypothetical protein [Nocardia seriolae]RLP30320.1 hypothetical protein D6158_19295 [Nocardia seriolae]WKY55297.1 hypothetical protein Q5P07_15555 [Nocardia seriolae]BEK89162.1 hypothetical protein NSERKGN1266_51130 [Nocardia seriolae]BEK96689.1 hypothetical protein NSER024013_45950 [Nocardia seriolae]GAM48414.1 hypothetical protein NS07_v2contig00073-0004 [Nocardia seriolae]